MEVPRGSAPAIFRQTNTAFKESSGTMPAQLYAAQKAIHDSCLILRFAQVLHLVRIRIELLGYRNELDRPDTGVYGYNLAF